MLAKAVLRLKRFLKLFDLNENLIRFIGGSEVLPQPYSSDEEAVMIERLGCGEKEVRDKLVEHNLRLVVYIARRFENTGVDLDDLVSVGTIGLIKAVNSFNAEKNIKLATYASRCVENEILMHLRRTVKLKSEVSFDALSAIYCILASKYGPGHDVAAYIWCQVRFCPGTRCPKPFRLAMSAIRRMPDSNVASDTGQSPPTAEFENSIVTARWLAGQLEFVQATQFSSTYQAISPSTPMP